MNALHLRFPVAIRLLVTCLITTLFSSSLPATICTSTEINLNTQSEVDNFQATYGVQGACDSVNGNLTIRGNDIDDLTPLSALKTVTEYLVIRDTMALTTLEGLSALTFLGGLIIENNAALISIDGLSSLEMIHGQFRLANNAVLNRLDGLKKLTQIYGALEIEDNERLNQIEGLSSLTYIEGHVRLVNNIILSGLNGLSSLTQAGYYWGVYNGLEIIGNRKLSHIDGLSALTTINGIVIIADNDQLANIDGLSALKTVSAGMIIEDNAKLPNLDSLSALERVGYSLWIKGNKNLRDLHGLSALKSIPGSLVIIENERLPNLDGLSGLSEVIGNVKIADNRSLNNILGLLNVTYVGKGILIKNNDSLVNLDGLSNLTVTGDLWPLNPPQLVISSNHVLANLDGLSALVSAHSVRISDNPELSDCSGLTALLDPMDHGEPGPGPGEAGIPDVEETVEIHGPPGCNSVNDILAKAPLADINTGLSDAWWNPETAGQGVFLIVLPEIRSIYLAWLTFDTGRPPDDVTAMLGDPGQRWLTAFGSYEDNVAELDIYVTRGGIFDSSEPEPYSEPDGEMLIEFSTCNTATAIYDIPSIGSHGAMPLERITLDNVSMCYQLGYAATDANR